MQFIQLNLVGKWRNKTAFLAFAVSILTGMSFFEASSAFAVETSPAKIEVKAEAKPLSPYGETYGVPNVLSDKDAELYKKMFRYQRAGLRDKVVQYLPELKDGVLMGHLIAERLLHPTKRASYDDLKKWLERYSDQSPAADIYSLANSRKPRNVQHKKPDVLKASIARYSDPDEDDIEDNVENTSDRRQLLKNLKSYRIKKHYAKATQKLSLVSNKKLLGEDTWAQVSLKLARAMVHDEQFANARKLSSLVVAGTEMRRSEALWLAGFSSYMLGDKKTAAGHFRRLAYSVPVGSSYFSKGAFWAAKAYSEQKETNIAQVFYNLAARDEDSFYGLVAAQKLNKKQEWSWKRIPAISDEEMKTLYSDARIRRVIALAQIGEIGLAQEELKMSNGGFPYEMDPALLAFSVRLGLPNTSMTLGYNLQERGRFYASAVYPDMRNWMPSGGYQDKALVHAIARQESAFKPDVKSHAGARGLMQLMPNTAKYIRRINNKPVYSTVALNRPYVNLNLGQDYLAYLADKFDGNLIKVVSAYNAGPSNVRKWVEADLGKGDPILFIESIPFIETRSYVEKVLRNYWMYQNRFGDEASALAALSKNQWPTLNTSPILSSAK